MRSMEYVKRGEGVYGFAYSHISPTHYGLTRWLMPITRNRPTH